MDYEKAYTNAVARAKQAIKDCGHNEGRKRMIEDIFPELTDPDRIRQELIQYLKDYPNLPNGRYCRDDFFAWLEKQGEQKPTNIEPKFKVGDWVVHDMSDGRKDIRQIIGMTNKSYILDCEDFNTFYFNDLENDYHLWTIEDAKDGDVLIYPVDNGKTLIFIYESLCESFDGEVYAHALLDGDDYFSGSVGSVCCKFMDILKPATKEQRDLLFQKMKEAGYEWDAENKELKKIEQNLSWSEEDEKIMKQIDSLLYSQCTIHSSMYEKLHNWLKSLKPQSHWKPTDEQMENLEYVINMVDKCCEDSLQSLYNDLKKL